MNTLTDWERLQFAFKTKDGSEYEIEAIVFLEGKEVPDYYSRTGSDTKWTASLDGWDTLPPFKIEHEQEILNAIHVEMEERWA